MSDRFWAKISIGGEVPASLLEELYDNIISEINDYNIEKKTPNQSYKIWFKKHITGGVLEFSDGEARYGQFEDLEAFLEQNNIPYLRESDAYGEYAPEIRAFNGKEVVTQETNPDHVPTISVQTVKDWCKIATELHEEFKKGNAPTYIDAEPAFSTIHGLMAKYSLQAKQEPSSAELVLAVLNSQYPNIESLPPFTIKE